MKLLRYGPAGQEKPGMLAADGTLRDLSGTVADIAGDVISPEGLERLRAIDPQSLPVVEGEPRLGPCVVGLQKIVCIGLNYSDHAAETGAEPPEEPIIFAKALNALCGPNDDVEMPRGSTALDWEVELAVIIGRKTKYVSEAEAMDYVAGFAIMNDVSERNFQTKRSGQWTKGKSHDTFGPLGPWLVTRDEVADPHNLDMWLDVNGERRQTGNSNTLIFNVPHVIAYLSQFMTLMPGDVISTGTPPGVGMGMKPPQYLKPGDVMTLSIAGLGEQRQTVVQA
ncbi:fumarylacetoacetate hydrolase family protein [Nitratireductor aquimarinus]|uniref:fumarylacetoacetate hydrolase family protein n=1 Tax=Nitratireductor TaxID=245876 RepID=UPI0019D39861|nr:MULTISPECIES: fumarylacetoacetate hydrolase family protein [Nitratireductor]MBN7776163.1 fumarylacetoacetate hydrolase family protein [Nitratireductor pacificus]MBN7779030.1 fumarylacetoacetate hydrolase family protein [Nitratireductor pacificus]MBN7787837.1 fumarylacetoacetate hydrolase family protein [Nitratireductor aquimarinus]MBY6097884.1 fumarylacetoacetate hydrolase family protein [Nitratireductor aquimarinus]MCA1260359.1 fumarylacetoacetate hydrolase family protein [Nitratireductor 